MRCILKWLKQTQLSKKMKDIFEESRTLAIQEFIERDHPYFRGSDTLVYIPVYNEEQTIGKVISDVRANCIFDILIINDGSTDNTSSILSNVNIEVLNHPKRSGSMVILSGLEIAFKMGYRFAIKIDGDDQHDSHDIPRLYEQAVKTSADEVIGSRHLHDFNANIFSVQGLGMWFSTKLVFLLSRQRITDTTSGLKIWNRKACRIIIQAYNEGKLREGSTSLIEELLITAKNKLKVNEIAVIMYPRKFGESKAYSKKTLFMFPINLIRSIIRVYSS